jgi:dTDP-4-dehydrorhamnose 3,5-epimerase-like enzyme
MADMFTDERGTIEDILAGPVDCVTRIFTRKGAVRGNHVHAKTTQWTYVISGSLYVAFVADDWTKPLAATHGPGSLMCDQPGVAHAWRALADTEVLVFTRGPRSGEGYESDTIRLAVPLLS